MSLCIEMIKNIYGYSRAKYATWFYYKPDNLLFDVGEGVSLVMQNKIYAIDKILISHGHADHIGGLTGLLSSRASSMGDRNKPLIIYYPKGDRNIVKLKRYLEDALGKLPFEVEWEELKEGACIELADNRNLETFAARHTANSLTLGYKIVERRTRLKANCRDMRKDELLAVIQKEGKSKVSETYNHTLLCFSGDSMPLEISIVQEAELLLHDSTFLKAEDREEDTHATLSEIFELACKAKVCALALFHFSARYRHQEILKTIRRYIEERRILFPVFYQLPYSPPFLFKKISLEETKEKEYENF